MNNQSTAENLEPNEVLGVFVVYLPRSIFDDLLRIQGMWGVGLEILLRGALEDFVLNNWDFKANCPKQIRWNSETIRKKKPRSTRGFKTKLYGGNTYAK